MNKQAIWFFMFIQLACGSAQQVVIEQKKGNEIRFDLIKFCQDKDCSVNEPNFSIKRTSNNSVLVYVDLRESGELNLINRIKKGEMRAPQIVIKSFEGGELGRLPLNFKSFSYKLVQEVEYVSVPFATTDEKIISIKDNSILISKKVAEPYETEVKEFNYGDHDIVPQAIPLKIYSPSAKVNAYIYLDFDLTTSTVGEQNKNKKNKDDQVKIEQLTMKMSNLATPPFPVVITQ